MNKTVGIVLLVVGTLLVGYGYNQSQSLLGQTAALISGSPSNEVMYYYIGGGICALLGLVGVFKSK
ncbi:MAG: hypothetical protein COX57_04560 [Alphaproteobacteria bacterium CG_4_10_14_0_2_um_filter_63_37]|nr:MAG: hypothetical protein AUJ55_13080 [Proteobacteria bacterium CG1_02_64_396]PJA25172.1 MAG: hypothetical protein COX57_04560 [Alphaproteobacteria bacterium CG_4_10_14_0_2_um_filter_63_37]